MPEKIKPPLEPEKKRRLLSLFENLIPLVDSLSDKFRLFWIFGVLVSAWLAVWCFYLKHYPIGLTATVTFLSLLPTMVLARFWWALEELKSLPEIIGDMTEDAKSEFQSSVQNIRAGKAPKIGIFSAGKSLWSVGAMMTETRELLGSYLSVATLLNPLMLVLGALSIAGVAVLFIVGIALAFFV